MTVSQETEIGTFFISPSRGSCRSFESYSVRYEGETYIIKGECYVEEDGNVRAYIHQIINHETGGRPTYGCLTDYNIRGHVSSALKSIPKVTWTLLEEEQGRELIIKYKNLLERLEDLHSQLCCQTVFEYSEEEAMALQTLGQDLRRLTEERPNR